MQKVADAADRSVLLFSAGANFFRKQRVKHAGTGASITSATQ